MSLWTTKDGRRLPVGDMSDTHLQNATKMLRRNGYVTSEEFEYALGSAFSLNGEMAQMYAENEIASMKISRWLEVLEREIYTRTR